MLAGVRFYFAVQFMNRVFSPVWTEDEWVLFSGAIASNVDVSCYRKLYRIVVKMFCKIPSMSMHEYDLSFFLCQTMILDEN